jgi:prolyl 4-hydroxylase
MAATFQGSPELRRWIIQQTEAGHSPQALLAELVRNGYDEDQAITFMTAALESRVTELVSSKIVSEKPQDSVPLPIRVPQPIGTAWPSVVHALDRQVKVLFSLTLPRVVLFGGLLSDDECDELVALSRAHVTPSNVVDLDSGGEKLHADRTSSGAALTRGGTPLISRLEQRIAALLNWPVDHGEALQILRYEVGQEYKPHYDYVDPAQPGAAPFLARGGQRVASLVMYLNTPQDGGATNFPDIGLEVAAIKGNAVFFSYDRPHPSTKTLHGGMPVRAGEKWVATKWLRESPHH